MPFKRITGRTNCIPSGHTAVYIEVFDKITQWALHLVAPPSVESRIFDWFKIGSAIENIANAQSDSSNAGKLCIQSRHGTANSLANFHRLLFMLANGKVEYCIVP